jgi:hypothetical protein
MFGEELFDIGGDGCKLVGTVRGTKLAALPVFVFALQGHYAGAVDGRIRCPIRLLT